MNELNNLISIKGIGKKTLLDVKGLYSSKNELISDLRSGKHISLRDDIVSILKKKLL